MADSDGAHAGMNSANRQLCCIGSMKAAVSGIVSFKAKILARTRVYFAASFRVGIPFFIEHIDKPEYGIFQAVTPNASSVTIRATCYFVYLFVMPLRLDAAPVVQTANFIRVRLLEMHSSICTSHIAQ